MLLPFGFMIASESGGFGQVGSGRPVSGVIAATTAPVRIRWPAAETGSAQGIGRLAETGDKVYLDDVLRTGPGTTAQILLRDQSLFMIGPSSEILFDRFVYDPAEAEASSLRATIRAGSFKFISGKIAAQRPGAMELRLPGVTAAIRGTSGAGRVGDDGASELALLSGQIDVSAGSGDVVALISSGWGVSVSAEGEVSEPAPVPAETLETLVAGVEFSLDEEEATSPDQAAEPEQDAAADGTAPTEPAADDTAEADEPDGAKTPDKADADTGDETDAAGNLTTDTNEANPLIAPQTGRPAIADLEKGNKDAPGDGRFLPSRPIPTALRDNLRDYLQSRILETVKDPELQQQLELELEQRLATLDRLLNQPEPDRDTGPDEPAVVSPHYMQLLVNGRQLSFGNSPPVPAIYLDTLSDIYAGSVRFAEESIRLEPRGGLPGDGGVADVLVTLDYDRAAFEATYQVHSLTLGGRAYEDTANRFTHKQQAGVDRILVDPIFDAAGNRDLSRAGLDGTRNDLLETGESLTKVLLSAPGNTLDSKDGGLFAVQTYLKGSFGSTIEDGQVADGKFASLTVEAIEVQAVSRGEIAFTGVTAVGTRTSIGTSGDTSGDTRSDTRPVPDAPPDTERRDNPLR